MATRFHRRVVDIGTVAELVYAGALLQWLAVQLDISVCMLHTKVEVFEYRAWRNIGRQRWEHGLS